MESINNKLPLPIRDTDIEVACAAIITYANDFLTATYPEKIPQSSKGYLLGVKAHPIISARTVKMEERERIIQSRKRLKSAFIDHSKTARNLRIILEEFLAMYDMKDANTLGQEDEPLDAQYDGLCKKLKEATKEYYEAPCRIHRCDEGLQMEKNTWTMEAMALDKSKRTEGSRVK